MAKKKRRAGTRKKATTPRSSKTFTAKWYTPGRGPKASSKVFISEPELRELIAGQLKNKLAWNFGLYLADADYYCTPIDNAREIIRNSKVDRRTWLSEKFDCDDFAHVLKGNFVEAAYKDGARRKPHCFGVVWGKLPKPHAINWMVNADFRLRFIEPQTDRIFFPRRTDKEIYFMQG